MNDKQRLREIEEMLTVVLQEQERLKAEMRLLRTERDRAEERISKLEQAAEAQQQETIYGLVPFATSENLPLLQAELLLLLLAQPQTQN